MATYKDMLLDIIQPTTERQYGGGLDDAYMNRRSAFAAPDTNSAFASPMGQGGLPTIYRQDGGDYNYDYSFEDIGLNTADFVNEDFADSGGSYQDQYEAALGGQKENTSPSLASLVDDGIIDYDEAYNPQGIQRAMIDAEVRDRSEREGEYPNWYSARGAPTLDPKGIPRSLSERDQAKVQSLINSDKMTGLGIPGANILEDIYGLQTFEKGLRGPLATYSQGSAKDRNDPSLLAGENSESVEKLLTELRYTVPGETMKDFQERTNTSPEDLAILGFDINSPMDMDKNAEDVNSAIQSNNLRGLGQGLSLLAGIGSNPLTGMNAFTKGFTGERDSQGEPIASTGLGSIYDKVTGSLSDLVGKGKEAMFGPGESNFSKAEREAYAAKGISEKEYTEALQFAIDNKIAISDFANMPINGKQQPTLEEVGKVDVSGSGITATGILQAIDNPVGFTLDKISSGRPTTTGDIATERNQEAMATKDLSREGLLELVGEPSEAAKQEPTSFKNTVLNFFKSTGSPAIPDESTDLGPNDTVERKRVAKPTQQQVAAIVQEAVKIPEKVKKTITSAGLLPQYLALIEAGYTAEEAIKAVGLSAGTKLT